MCACNMQQAVRGVRFLQSLCPSPISFPAKRRFKTATSSEQKNVMCMIRFQHRTSNFSNMSLRIFMIFVRHRYDFASMIWFILKKQSVLFSVSGVPRGDCVCQRTGSSSSSSILQQRRTTGSIYLPNGVLFSAFPSSFLQPPYDQLTLLWR